MISKQYFTVSSANSLAFEDNPSDKWLIYIRNSNEPITKPWGKSDLKLGQSGTCPFNCQKVT